MKIEYIYEAGVFGSYKKTNAQSNIDNAKKELARDAQKSIIESKCDELAELYLDMLTEVNSKIDTVSYKYTYRTGIGEIYYVIPELSNYVVNRYFRKSEKKREVQLNIIKNVYCNRPAIEYMVSQGCFILPLVDTTNRWLDFENYKDAISYKNMTKAIADAAEKVIKQHLTKFNSNIFNIPDKVKIVILKELFTAYQASQEEKLLSYMGITDKSDFEYPVGQGSSFLNYILDNWSSLTYHCNIDLIKSNESIWKSIAGPSPWMFNNMSITSITADIYTLSADNFYGVKLLKFALDNGALFVSDIDVPAECRHIYITGTIPKKDMEYLKALDQEFFKNGLDKYVVYETKVI